jgi:starch synthase
VFRVYESRRLLAAIDRALSAFSHKDQWTRLMKNAMAADFSWTRSARGYLDIYRKLVSGAG